MNIEKKKIFLLKVEKKKLRRKILLFSGYNRTFQKSS